MLAYLVRHAESLTNSRQSDQMNPDLSQLGMRQVEALARRFRGMQITACYSSPFRRCLQTAAPLAAIHRLAIRIRPELHECYHLPVGRTLDTGLPAIEEACAEISTGFVGRVPAPRVEAVICPDWTGPYVVPSIHETGEDLFTRMKSFARYLKTRWGDDEASVLVVSHGSPLAKLIDAWLSEGPGPSYRYVVDNAALAVLRFDKGISTLVCLNELSHLAGIPAPEIANVAANGAAQAHRPPMC